MRNVTEGSAGGVTVGQERVMDLDFAGGLIVGVDGNDTEGGGGGRDEVTQKFVTNISGKKSEILYIG